MRDRWWTDLTIKVLCYGAFALMVLGGMYWNVAPGISLAAFERLALWVLGIYAGLVVLALFTETGIECARGLYGWLKARLIGPEGKH